MPNEVNQERQYDVNNIIVNISDKKTPIVIPFGPASAGKTMVLLRMIRWFTDVKHFKFNPDKLFRPGDDIKYQNLCNEFQNERPFADYAPGGAGDIEFLLFKIRDSDGRSRFQFLEAPGEHFFDGHVKTNFPPYIENIIGQNTPKIWVVLLQLDWGKSQSEREKYKQQILILKGKMRAEDKIIFLFNKADKRMDLFNDGKPDMRLFTEAVNDQYPNLLSQFEVSGFFNRMLFGSVSKLCFSAGAFSADTLTGKEMWICKPHDDWYCKNFYDMLG